MYKYILLFVWRCLAICFFLLKLSTFSFHYGRRLCHAYTQMTTTRYIAQIHWQVKSIHSSCDTGIGSENSRCKFRLQHPSIHSDGSDLSVSSVLFWTSNTFILVNYVEHATWFKSISSIFARTRGKKWPKWIKKDKHWLICIWNLSNVRLLCNRIPRIQSNSLFDLANFVVISFIRLCSWLVLVWRKANLQQSNIFFFSLPSPLLSHPPFLPLHLCRLLSFFFDCRIDVQFVGKQIQFFFFHSWWPVWNGAMRFLRILSTLTCYVSGTLREPVLCDETKMVALFWCPFHTFC